MNKPKPKKLRPPMDDLTAIAFARQAFDALHPASARPQWLWRFSTSVARFDADRNFIVHFAWKPKAHWQPIDFFTAHVNAWNAETKVLLDIPIDTYRQDELEEYL
jgi:hypothetical protein